jgi:hypothetical protein
VYDSDPDARDNDRAGPVSQTVSDAAGATRDHAGAIAGVVLYQAGRARLRTVSPVPNRTVETLKEDARWMKNPTG